MSKSGVINQIESNIFLFKILLQRDRQFEENDEERITEMYDLRLFQSVGAIEHTDCISAKALESPCNECLGYNTKKILYEVPVFELWEI